MKKFFAGTALVAAVALALTGCAAPAPEPDDSGDGAPNIGRVTLALTSPTWSAGYAPFAVAESLGYFEEEGVDINFILTSGGSDAATQVAQGAADIGTISTEPIMVGEATDKGLDIVSFYDLYRQSIFSVRAPEGSGITDIADLEGKKVGVPSLAAVGVNILVANLQLAGLTRDDVTLIEIGAGGQAVAAVQNGGVDAVASDDVMFALLDNAGTPMVDLTSGDTSSLMSNGLAATRTSVSERPEMLQAVGRAIAKATLFTVTNPEAAIEILWASYPETKAQDVSDDEAMTQALAVLNARIKALQLEDGARWGEFPEGAYQASVDFAVSTGLIPQEIDADTLYTNEFVDFFNDFDAAAVEEQATSAE